MSDESDLIL